MKKLTFTIIFFTFVNFAFAGMTCREDYLGNVVCTGTGDDYGYETRGSRDYLGNEVWRDNQGNTTTCREDYLGNTVCN